MIRTITFPSQKQDACLGLVRVKHAVLWREEAGVRSPSAGHAEQALVLCSVSREWWLVLGKRKGGQKWERGC